MSPDQDPSREDRDALLTAYALGMVTPEERTDVERLLAAPDAAAAGPTLPRSASRLRHSRPPAPARCRSDPPICGGPCSPPRLAPRR